MGTDTTCMQMALNILENGKMICSMDTERRLGLMVAHSKVTTNSERKRVKENIIGLMGRVLQGVGVTTRSTVLVFTHGLTVESSKAAGLTTTCTERAPIVGQMVDCTWVNTRMTRSTVTVFTPGAMDDSIMGSGKMENSTAKAFIDTQMGTVGRAFGTKGSEHCGLMNSEN